jgi:hypothetical protein
VVADRVVPSGLGRGIWELLGVGSVAERVLLGIGDFGRGLGVWVRGVLLGELVGVGCGGRVGVGGGQWGRVAAAENAVLSEPWGALWGLDFFGGLLLVFF